MVAVYVDDVIANGVGLDGVWRSLRVWYTFDDQAECRLILGMCVSQFVRGGVFCARISMSGYVMMIVERYVAAFGRVPVIADLPSTAHLRSEDKSAFPLTEKRLLHTLHEFVGMASWLAGGSRP